MADGALGHSEADVSVAITGYAGPGEGEEGLVHIAALRRGWPEAAHREKHYGRMGRAGIRALAAQDALHLLRDAIA
jgi:nicotinamide-nucleotide amidase